MRRAEWDRALASTWRQPRSHVQRGRRTQHPEWAPGHPEEPMVDERGHLDLEFAIELAHRRLERKRHGPPRPLQLAPYPQTTVAGGRDVVGREPQARMRLDVE